LVVFLSGSYFSAAEVAGIQFNPSDVVGGRIGASLAISPATAITAGFNVAYLTDTYAADLVLPNSDRLLSSVDVGAFADDRSQTNVYDEFRHLGAPSPNVTVDEQVTALIKRSMANLLYPVDMSSLVSPDKDTKFRDQIIVLQQQMGGPASVLQGC
jgi:hypothetical protein